MKHYGDERLTGSQEVVGSSPILSTDYKGVQHQLN